MPTPKNNNPGYDFPMPLDIEEQLREFSFACFEPDSPLLAWMAAYHDENERILNDPRSDLDGVEEWKSKLNSHLRKIRDLLMEKFSGIIEDYDFMRSTATVLMVQSQSKPTISRFDIETLIRHKIRQYMVDNPGALDVHNVVSNLDDNMARGMNWYKRAQSDGDEPDEDMIGAVRDGLEAHEVESYLDRVRSEMSGYGKTMDVPQEKWAYALIKRMLALKSPPDKNRLHEMAISIMLTGFTNNTLDNMWLQINKWSQNMIDMIGILMKRGIINDLLSFGLVTGIYMSFIKTTGVDFPPEAVAELVTAEMAFRK